MNTKHVRQTGIRSVILNNKNGTKYFFRSLQGHILQLVAFHILASPIFSFGAWIEDVLWNITQKYAKIEANHTIYVNVTRQCFNMNPHIMLINSFLFISLFTH